MCGIAGILSENPNQVSKEKLVNMTNSIIHRGPDGSGHWVSEDGKVGFGHRRLSILDLSESGAQPMHYLDRYTLTFNGEIYNYLEIKERLIKNGYQFRSHSDTEVLLALFDLKRERCLEDLDGMFAFALYDKQTGEVFCARDRFGEKPFFYTQIEGAFFFASEMKEFWALGISKIPDSEMVFNYLHYDLLDNHSDSGQTFYKGVRRLEPGHYLVWKNGKFQIKNYWRIDPLKQNRSISLAEAKEKFRSLFMESVSRRLRSDVLVGSSLSGGIDSSLVVCAIDDLLKDHPESIQNTFSARFRNFHKDEGYFIDKVREQTRITSHEIYSDMDEMEGVFDKICYHQEEPFGSASILVQYQVYELAKKHGVTVLLDGQGADEILAGYHPYFTTFFNEIRKKSGSKFEKEFSSYLHLHQQNEINAKVAKPGLKQSVASRFPSLINKVGRKVVNYKKKNSTLMSDDFFGQYKKKAYNDFNFDLGNLNSHLYFSTFEVGLPTLLRYADRNSMAHSREVRLPFLSHDLVEFVFSMPAEFKIHNGWTKYLMREAFQGLLPEEITWRKDKIGFEPPQKSWMESSKSQEKIRAAREVLSKEGILKLGAKDLPIVSQAANTQGDGSWSHLMVAKMYES
ncbi:asparagine synthase (glutamine-hydrolysing) [Algoriphagus ratkowskyi]|uniref:asparagine synthase (glutamine-hydrolyzing) n=1 Tax=Algoriphagus ratkowskyi TaxID=57028 RepID=A0A2W7RR04_9BACT|nr:asparagine synthase (glutamine-hydrolyzing) [Algoriphagus ratkowskyi]PZX57777.1 asparagine synthase (glutamine-hydrolysing) [Algoriphagus ratkowskyi]TXD79041.1 asparagine synthase (glutamine-hydrolyzing) [Algoriphagus ratkowskyi]